MADQSKRATRHSVDMTTGPLFLNILKYILPLIATNLLQQFYSAADIMIVGLSSEPNAVGAVGSAGAFMALIVNIFIGFSVGANVVVARNIGAGDGERASRAVHTAICMSVISGMLGAAIGISLTRTVLVSMGYTGDLLALGSRYVYIYFCCMPFAALTNFLSAILQAQGNTKTSLYTLTCAGLLNVGLNLFFVLVLDLSVEGVALATAAANLFSAIVLLKALSGKHNKCPFCFRKLRLWRAEALEILRIGLPAGIQAAMFSVSNMLIQTSILQVNNMVTPPNSPYDPIIKGNTAVASLEGFVFTALGATTVTASAFTAQNVGANNYRRVRQALGHICLISAVLALGLSIAGMLLRTPLLALYGVEKGEDLLSILAYDSAITRIMWKWPAFLVYAMMNACSGTLRGLGKSGLAALIAFLGTCAFRVIWIYTVFRHYLNLESIHISYPISWLITGVCFAVIVFRMLWKKQNEPKGDSVIE